MPNYAGYKHHFHSLGAHHFIKASYEISARSLTEVLSKGGKSAKANELCLVMPINATYCNFLEIVFLIFK